GVGAKYLLVGLMRCGCCGGGLLVKSRQHGRKRNHRYGCSTYHLRGASICANGLELPLDAAHTLILDAVEQDLLAPDVVEMAIAEAVETLATPAPIEGTEQRQRELRDVEGELRRLTTALASGGDMTSLVDAIREREQRRSRIERALAAMTAVRGLD